MGHGVRFDDFVIWVDRNSNGKSEKKELFSLDDLGITGIGLERSNLALLNPGQPTEQILGTSMFTTANGRSETVGDLALYSNWTPDCGCGTGARVGATDAWAL